MFFQWRAPAGGAEQFHSAMVPHAGPDSRVFRESVRLGETLDRLAEITAGETTASVALAWDAASGWALRHPGMPSALLDGHAELAAAHRALWRAGYGCDVVVPGDPLDRYRLLVLPALYLADDATAGWVHDHVEAGGHLLVSYLSGVADPHARVHLGGYPGAYRDLLGLRVEEAPIHSPPTSRCCSPAAGPAGSGRRPCTCAAPNRSARTSAGCSTADRR